MVKFSFLALAAAAAATINAASAAASGNVVKKSIKLGNRNLRRGDPATEALLKKAIPYKKSGGNTISNEVSRRLQDNNEGVDGSYYIQFSECMDVKLYDEDLFGENTINYVKNGQIVAAKSYVLFHVCQKDSCYLESDDDLYLVDLATYLVNIAQYYANKRTDYCEQCQQYADYCNPAQEEEEAAEAAADEGEANAEEANAEQEVAEEEAAEEGQGEGEAQNNAEGEGEGGARRKRKLTESQINRELASAIDCNQCATYECFNNQENLDDQVQRNENLDNEVSGWIGQLAECQQTGVMWDNIMNLYVGAMCDQYGDGVELAVFANEDCTWYTNQYAFNDVYSFNANGDANGDGNNANDSINYLMYAEEFIKSAFSELTPCAQLQFADPNGEGEEEGDEQNEMNDYCRGVLEENAVSFVNCAADNEEEEQNQNNNAANYDWFTYDMEEADDANDVCAMLKKKQSGDYSHAYNQEGSGSWYTRDKSGNIVSGKSQLSDGLSAGAIVGIVIAVLAVLLIAVGVGRSCSSSRKRHVDADYSGGEMS